GTFVINLAIVTFILVKLPANHFSKSRKTKFWSGPHPLLHAASIVGKNIGGVLLVALGIVLSLPGVPGQGLLTVLLGLMLLDFPGKRRLEQRIVRRPRVRKTIDAIRARFGVQPLILEKDEPSGPG